MKIRTRFAPSPTGYLHLGGARTALFAWAYARHSGGEFVLRIEDTDRERSTQAACDAIMESMGWLGLNYDEGPIYQTQRFPRYFQVANQLLEEGRAYRCDCSKERLDILREGQMARGEKPRYDGHCRDLNLKGTGFGDPNHPQVVRFRTPEVGFVSWVDGVRGEIVFNNNELDDLIMIRSDGNPTYNFCVVVDDIDMNITHVIRGEDHVNNTPRQIHLYWALEANVPHFSHVPSILGSDGKKLSKRHGALSVMEYRNAGFMPEALMNGLIKLGWSFKDEEIFSRDEIIQKFSIESVSKSPAAFNMDKLLWLNQHYLKTLPIDRVMAEFQWHLDQSGLNISQGPDLKAVLLVMRERVKTLQELVEQIRYFYQPIQAYDPAGLEKIIKDPKLSPQEVREQIAHVMEKLQEKLSKLSKLDSADSWQVANIHQVLTDTATELSVGMGKIGMPLRLALTGSLQSPSIDVTCHLLGLEVCLERIQQFKEKIVDFGKSS
jgi:glutamyl-tRNA synthetase